MKFLLPLLLLLTACGAPEPYDWSEFDAYLDKLMAEPYDPQNGSKY